MPEIDRAVADNYRALAKQRGISLAELADSFDGDTTVGGRLVAAWARAEHERTADKSAADKRADTGGKAPESGKPADKRNTDQSAVRRA